MNISLVSVLYPSDSENRFRQLGNGFLEEDIINYLYGRTPTGRPVRSSGDKRQSPRMNTRLSTTLTPLLSNHPSSRQGVIHNLSEGGMLASLDAKDQSSFAVGDPIKIMFLIDNGHSKTLEAEGRVVHQKIGLGIKFRHLSQSNQKVIRHYVG